MTASKGKQAKTKGSKGKPFMVGKGKPVKGKKPEDEMKSPKGKKKAKKK